MKQKALLLLLIGCLFGLGTGIAFGAEGFELATDTEQSVVAGDESTITANITTTPQLRGATQDIELTLLVDNTTQATQTVTVNRDDSVEEQFTYTFEKPGERNVTVVAEYSTGESTETAIDSVVVSVSEAESETTTGSDEDTSGTDSAGEEMSAYENCLEQAESQWTKTAIGCDFEYDRGFLSGYFNTEAGSSWWDF